MGNLETGGDDFEPWNLMFGPMNCTQLKILYEGTTGKKQQHVKHFGNRRRQRARRTKKMLKKHRNR